MACTKLAQFIPSRARKMYCLGQVLLLLDVYHSKNLTTQRPQSGQSPLSFSWKTTACLWRLRRRDCQYSSTCWNIFSSWPKAYAAVHCSLLFKVNFVSQSVREQATCTELNKSSGLSGHSAVHWTRSQSVWEQGACSPPWWALSYSASLKPKPTSCIINPAVCFFAAVTLMCFKVSKMQVNIIVVQSSSNSACWASHWLWLGQSAVTVKLCPPMTFSLY